MGEGVAAIRDSLNTMPSSPGVYRMANRRGEALYVGKARNLKKRVTSYANPTRQVNRIARMIHETATVEIVTTHTEAEALLLEANMIKRLKPRYNIVLRDDKSHPYILLTRDHDWPQLLKHRGARARGGEYFGPFASAGAVNRTLNALQRAFPLRTCSDGVFRARTRPCLQYQIKRCTAPCVNYISAQDYDVMVRESRDFLSGKSLQVQRQLAARMQQASDSQEFETAAVLRDRIRALTQIQSHQGINVRSVDEADVIAAHQQAGQTCIQVFYFRDGRNYGNRAHYPSHHRDQDAAAVLGAFLGQFYDGRAAPRLVLLSQRIDGQTLVEQALGLRAERRVRLICPRRGDKRRLIEHARVNAREALERRLAESASQRRLMDGIARMFALDGPPRRIEVYDNSHIAGSQAVGAMIVADAEGMVKNAYRKFNIKNTDKPREDGGIVAGDDYGMMREVLTRRFSRLQKDDPDRDRGQWPDLVLIDGGAGHLSAVAQVFADLGVIDVALAAIAKGPERDAGREKFHLPGRAPFTLAPNDPVLYFLQRLRDEAHRFAIGSHRARRSKAIGRSELDSVAGVGPKRKRALLHRFGSARAVAQAGLADLETVDGINKTVARLVYDHFHGEP
ncbi:MAG: excinuclease ABC subunit UvrC [Alphaproteobacteria bacterium]|nr:excinuclease ABC subunit UvrC [Alphaproteobacteria bacterium]